ncbi:MAG: hypothetical protein HDS71_08090 [Bacteroidales bacterium]|nr:hypothetical protein [Bacteroidales bacterium]MBD5223988.1 hypothetical protein [Bacteroidales bacterium]MBD5301932.1 hypothetical protein [Bacteroides sp.]
MTWIVWLGIISGIASIVSLIFTIIETRKARKAASEAIKARESIIAKQSTLELKTLLDVAGEIQQHLIKRTSPNQGSNQGHNILKEHKLIEDFLSKLNEVRSLNSDDDFVATIDLEYKFLYDANGKDPKPYRDMLEHVRIVITHINRVVRNNIYS